MKKKPVGKTKIIIIIESELAKYANEQVNLASEAARNQIAPQILEALSRKYFITGYDTQEDYE